MKHYRAEFVDNHNPRGLSIPVFVEAETEEEAVSRSLEAAHTTLYEESPGKLGTFQSIMEIDEELFSAESAIVLAHWKWRQSGSEEKAAKQGVTDAKRAKSRLLSDRQAAEEMAFKNRMMEKYGMVGHKKAEKVWEMAWDEGHSSGYGEVELYFAEFAELAR